MDELMPLRYETQRSPARAVVVDASGWITYPLVTYGPQVIGFVRLPNTAPRPEILVTERGVFELDRTFNSDLENDYEFAFWERRGYTPTPGSITWAEEGKP